MSWIVAGTALGSAVLGASQAAEKRKAEQASNQANANITAAQTQFSPWTHMEPQKFQAQAPTATALGGAFQGGVGGALQGMGFKQSQAEQALLDAKRQQALANLGGGNPNVAG